MPTTSAAKMTSSALPFFTFSFSFGTSVGTQGRLPSGLRLRLPKPYRRFNGTWFFQLALLEHNFVLLAVGQGQEALAVHLVLLEATLVLVAVGPSEGALAILEAALVLAVVLHLAAAPGVGALTKLEAALPETYVHVAVGPDLLALSVSAISCANAFDVVPRFHRTRFLARIRIQLPPAKSAPHLHLATCVELQVFLDWFGHFAARDSSDYFEAEHLELRVPSGFVPHFKSHIYQLHLVQKAVVQLAVVVFGIVFVKRNEDARDVVDRHGLGHFFGGREPPVLLPVPSASCEIVCTFALGCLAPFCVCQLKTIDGGDELFQGLSGIKVFLTSRPETGPKHWCFASIERGAGEVVLPVIHVLALNGVPRHGAAVATWYMPLTSLREPFPQGAKLLGTLILRAVAGSRLKIDILHLSVASIPGLKSERNMK